MDWGEAALRLEPKIDLSRIPRSVADRLQSASPLYVACSGGADSVFALLLVRLYLKKCDRLGSLQVLHFDHALRGLASAEDAAFVESLCEALGISFLLGKAKWPEASGKVSEAVARERRLAFFREASGSSLAAAATIVTGHHADDVVETMLMRLSRGAGLRGLCAPREISEAGGGLLFLRPLLDWGRSEIRASLEESGLPWREDETNVSDANYRSRLRKEAIPAWEAAADRPIRPGLGRSRSLLAEDAAALDELAEAAWRKAWDDSEHALRRREVEAAPVAIRRRLLLMWQAGAQASAVAVEEALEAVESGKSLKLEIGPGLFYEFSKDWLRFVTVDLDTGSRSWSRFALPVGACAYLPDGAKLSCEFVPVGEELRKKLESRSNDDRRIVYLGVDGNSCRRIVVRRRVPGDAFKPLGKSSPKKLKNLFIDRKIDRIARDRLPVFVCEESGILWVPGLPPSADCMLGFGSKAALRLTYDR